MFATAAPPPFQPRLAPTRYQQAVWLLPLGLALGFVGLIAYWAQVNDAQQRDAFVRTLATDSDSVAAQLTARQDFEREKLREVAGHLARLKEANDADLRRLPEVVSGFDRLWNRLVWIDSDMQLIARATRSGRPPPNTADELHVEATGQADHFVIVVPETPGRRAGQLLARYEMTDLLRSTDLAWLNNRYQVEFLSELGEVIATTASPTRVPVGPSMDRPLSAFHDATLRLTAFAALDSWRTNTRTLVLLLGLLLLGAAASELIRRQMGRVARAVAIAQTEAAWRQSMEESALVGLRARDHEGRVLYVNKKMCEMVGYSREELVGLIPPLPYWPAHAINALMAQNRHTLAGDAPAGGFETRWKHRDGRPLDVMVFESPLVNSEGVHIGWMGSIVDISVRKQLEENERRYLELQAQHARLSDLGLIASELAHELNQPLTAIASYSAGLRMALEKQAAPHPDLAFAVAEVQKHANKAGEIVNWIRRQSSRNDPLRAPCPINDVLAECLAHRSQPLVRAGIQLQLECGAELPKVVMDRVGIEQAIANLLRNSADALAGLAGEKIIRVATAQRPGGQVEVRVSDNGPGLGGQTIEDLCATFYSTKSQGMGLGLGICRAIAESHGGSLQAHDAPGGGAIFTLLLPAAQTD